MSEYKFENLSPFKFFMLETFPFIQQEYFDAMNEWQMFCKVGEKINEIINSQNSVGQETEALYNAFINLQNYINHYFDTLDVQDEVNNKLNDMAESGELAELISQYLESQAVIGFNNNTQLAQARNLANGSFARTYGKTTYNDGKGSFYKIRTRTNADTPDGDNIIVLVNTNNLVAEKMFDNDILNIKADINLIKNKNVIMIGDSYANRENSWQDRLKSFIGLTNENCVMKRVSGTGFVNTVDGQNFRTMVTNNISIPAEKVTDIIVCGGYNDHGYDNETQLTAIQNFLNTCKTTYPNAKVYIGFISWAKPGLTNYANIIGELQRTRNNYMLCSTYYSKAYYLNNVEYALHSADNIDDSYFHPTASGQYILAYHILNSWLTGYTNVSTTSLNVTDGFTPATNIQFNTNDRFYSEIENNLSRLFAQNTLQFMFDQTTLYNTNGSITLGTLSKGYVFGKNGILKSPVMALVNTKNNGYFFIPAVFKINEGEISLELHILNRQGNNWLGEDALKYIIVYGLNLWCDSMEQY